MFLLAGLDLGPPVYASHIAEMTGMLHCTQLLLVAVSSPEPFIWAGLKP
jgi:hypothetical protein